ncbi:pectinesterase family protein [Nonomuraea soli]|uniref:Pectate lyase n=1 Tax=Nonomuraea soli TaxID=1032476 RepID=A0A7W0CD03_9ACTN|nr:pectinesterase family protein [Nonomuraea soli]MBA2888903.1 pectate lyase [Nonomuraea soli]
MRRLLLLALAVLALTPTPAAAQHRTTLVVAADGSGQFTTVQAAVDAVPPGNTRPVTILVREGTYKQQVVIPADKPYISLVGATRDPSRVVLTFDAAASQQKPDGSGTYGTSGSASYVISADDFTARNLTFENAYDEAAAGSSQAVAVRTVGDRQVYDNVRFIGNQDTLYANSPSTTSFSRQYFRNCYVEGDVDFIFGRATAVFDRCRIKSLTRGSTTNNGYVAAPSTEITNPYGFLIYRSQLVSTAPAQTVFLARPWHAGGSATAVGQLVVRESWLGQQVKEIPYDDMSGFSWRDARFAEYRNSGPGSTANADRKQLTDAEAAQFTPQRYLAGDDGWNPVPHDHGHAAGPADAAGAAVTAGAAGDQFAASTEGHRGHGSFRLGRETLAPNDGWAAATTGTTGGSAAWNDSVHVVSSRAELVEALGDPADNTPRIIYVKGTIDADVDSSGRILTCADYATAGYTLDGYLAAYDPAVWGRSTRPSGPMEDARKASYNAMAAHITVRLGSNTTLIGLGDDAALKSFGIRIQNVDNVIVRNLSISDTSDCFPAWDPTDGAEGAWNASFDNFEVSGATHVWLDHNTLDDGDNPDSNQPVHFGRPYQVHDGLLDVVRGSTYVTLSWNHLSNHDKTTLIGNTDNPNSYGEADKLKVTVHHNYFDGLGQRVPRVRFGQVHVYNNLYKGITAYSIGVGFGSKVFAESNAFVGSRLLSVIGGTAISQRGNLVDGVETDLIAASGVTLTPDAGWTPTLFTRIDPPRSLQGIVPARAGAGRIR